MLGVYDVASARTDPDRAQQDRGRGANERELRYVVRYGDSPPFECIGRSHIGSVHDRIDIS